MAHKDQNTARTKAARELQAENPGMSYTRAWNIVGQEHDDAKVTEILNELRDHAQEWEDDLDRFEVMLDELVEGPQPQIDPYVIARMDKDCRLTRLKIDDRAIAEYTPEKLAHIVTQTLQVVHDDTDRKVRQAHAEAGWEIGEPDRSSSPDLLITAADETGLTASLDRWARPARCSIEEHATRCGAAILSLRITRLCKAAHAVVRQLMQTLEDPRDASLWLAEDPNDASHGTDRSPGITVKIHQQAPTP